MAQTLKNRIKTSPFVQNILKRTSTVKGKTIRIIDRHPLASFFGFLGLIVAIIVIGSTLRKPPTAPSEEHKTPKTVEVYSIGNAPRLSFSGKIEKSGALKINAQTGGVLQMINKVEGARVTKGETLFGFSNNYQGGNISSVSRQIAEKSYKASLDNYPVQKEMIAKRREIAQKSDTLADDQRKITNDSLQSTKDLLAFNQDLLTSINSQISVIESTTNDPSTLLQLNQAKSGVLSGINSLQSGLRSAEYSSQEGNAPAKISDLTRELTEKQLDVEQRSLDLSVEVAHLNLKIAKISESLMYPGAPCTGVLERIYVNIGQAINPGQMLASFVCDKNVGNVVVLVSGDIARQLSRLETSTLIVGETRLDLTPRYISTEPTDGVLYSVLFTLPDELADTISNGSSIPVEMPIGNARSTAAVPYIPIDSIFQTQTNAIVYVATQSAEGKFITQGRDIKLGPVYGSYVEVQNGLSASDQVILNRNVIAGDEVTFK